MVRAYVEHALIGRVDGAPSIRPEPVVQHGAGPASFSLCVACKRHVRVHAGSPRKLKDIGSPLDTCHKLFKMTEIQSSEISHIRPSFFISPEKG